MIRTSSRDHRRDSSANADHGSPCLHPVLGDSPTRRRARASAASVVRRSSLWLKAAERLVEAAIGHPQVELGGRALGGRRLVAGERADPSATACTPRSPARSRRRRSAPGRTADRGSASRWSIKSRSTVRPNRATRRASESAIGRSIGVATGTTGVRTIRPKSLAREAPERRQERAGLLEARRACP